MGPKVIEGILVWSNRVINNVNFEEKVEDRQAK